MRKDRVLNMLDNAEDNIVERLSVPALTDNEKERLLKMSMSKLEGMSMNINAEEEVRGVDVYRRPRWHRFVSVAAAIALVSGAVGTGFLLKRSGKKPEDSFHAVVSPEQTTELTTADTVSTDVTTELATENTVIPGTSETTADYQAIAVDLMKAMNAAELASSGMLNTDANSPLASDSNYFKIVDGNIKGFDFSTMENVRNFLTDNFSGKFYEQHSYFIEGSDPFFKEGPDGLYARYTGRGSIYGWDKYEPEIISSSEDSFVARAEYEIAGTTFQVDMTIVKSEDKWRVDSATSTLSDPDANNTNNSNPYVSLCKSKIEDKWNELTNESDNVSLDFVFNDLDGDGSPEFFLMYGNGEYNYQIDAYTYKDGALKAIGNLPGSHTSFAVDTSSRKLVLIHAHMGAGDYSWYTMENDALKVIKNEEFEYQEWGSNEATSRQDINYLSKGCIYKIGDGTVSYTQPECPINEIPRSNEINSFTLDIVDQLYASAAE
ncbi:MAG: hypothetical protein IKO47_11845 [Ruminococcus sp.]|nr:hypothetical protein [Ruminococcus sp.]